MRSPTRGQIYRLKSDTVGNRRPVLVVSPVQLNGGQTLSAVPFYSQQVEKRMGLKTCVHFAAGEFGHDMECVAKADEVSLFKISELRVSEGIVGEVDMLRMQQGSQALCYALGIELAITPAS